MIARLPLQVAADHAFDLSLPAMTVALGVTMTLVAAVLCAPGLWRARSPLLAVAAILLLGLGAHTTHRELGASIDRRFLAADLDYESEIRPFTGRSLYIPAPCQVALAAYGREGDGSDAGCGLPIAERLRDGTLDLVEIGGRDHKALLRFELAVGDPDCFGPTRAELPGAMISPQFGICVRTRDGELPQSTHSLNFDYARAPSPGVAWIRHVELRDYVTGEILDQFDGWPGATPYSAGLRPPEARRPTATLAVLLDRPGVTPDLLQRATAARLLRAHGPAPVMLRAGIAAGPSSERAEVLWFACRDDVRPRLDPATLSALDAGAKGLFPSQPDFDFPDDCRPFARNTDDSDLDGIDLRLSGALLGDGALLWDGG